MVQLSTLYYINPECHKAHYHKPTDNSIVPIANSK